MLIKFYMKERNNFNLVKSEQFLMYFILNPTISTLFRNDFFLLLLLLFACFGDLTLFFSPIAVDFFLILTIMCHKFLVFICVLDIYANT